MAHRVLLLLAGALAALSLADCPHTVDPHKFKDFPYLYNASGNTYFPGTGAFVLDVAAANVTGRSEPRIVVGNSSSFGYPGKYWSLRELPSACLHVWRLSVPWSTFADTSLGAITRTETTEQILYRIKLLFEFNETFAFPGSTSATSLRSFRSTLSLQVKYSKHITLESDTAYITGPMNLTLKMLSTSNVDVDNATLRVYAQSTVNTPYYVKSLASWVDSPSKNHFSTINITTTATAVTMDDAGDNYLQTWSVLLTPADGVCKIADTFNVTLIATCAPGQSRCAITGWAQPVSFTLSVTSSVFCSVTEVLASVSGDVTLYADSGFSYQKTIYKSGESIYGAAALSGENTIVTSSKVVAAQLIGPPISGYTKTLYANSAAVAGSFQQLSSVSTAEKPAWYFVLDSTLLNMTAGTDVAAKLFVQLKTSLEGYIGDADDPEVVFYGTQDLYMTKWFTVRADAAEQQSNHQSYWMYPVIGVVGGALAAAGIFGALFACIA